MAKRHEFRPGDWESIAMRLDEIISAHSGEDPFEEALKLLVARLAHEVVGINDQGFLAHSHDADAVRETNRLIGIAGERWRGILEPGAATRLSGPELVRCAAVLHSVRLLADDLVGLDAIFEFIVNKAAKGQKGQYFTPRHVIAEVVGMLRPRPDERVADPASGSGGFLRNALFYEPKCSVWGFDLDPRASRVARAMMAASGQSAARIMRCDSLRRPNHKLFPEPAPVIEELMRAQDPKFRGFDIILTNPPFAGDVGTEYADSYELARGKRVERDVLFIERCVELLKPGGRLAMVLPYNKVGGEQWGYMRQWLMERMKIVGVIGLGRNTFQPHTSQKACVLIGIKRMKQVTQFRNDEILFFISERDGKDNRGRLLYSADGNGIEHDLLEATPLIRSRFDLIAEEG